MSRPATSAAVSRIAVALFGKDWRRAAKRRGLDADAVHRALAAGLSGALRDLGRRSSPAERFSLSSWAAQVQIDHAIPSKASP